MDKNRVKFLVDILMFVDFLVVAISGFILWFVLPRGSGRMGNSFIFAREQWIWLHNWGSVLLLAFILLHLILNWIWIKSVFFGIFNKRKK